MQRFQTRPALTTLAALSVAALLAACGPEDGTPAAANAPAASPAAAPAPAPSTAPRADAPAATPAPAPAPLAFGTVQAVVPIRTAADPTGAGAVVGGVLGAAVGNQVGDGNGRKLATVIGAVGGAKVGHEVEKRRSTDVTGYRVDVVFDAGGTRSFTLGSADGFSTGQRVRVVDGRLLPA